jgi:hypothetical protein
MEQDLHATKTAALPSQGATDTHIDATEVGKSEEHQIDHTAMEMAKRANNRTKMHEDSAPGNTIFTK